MTVVRINGLLEAAPHSLAWSMPFYYAALVSLIVIALHVAFKVDLNRFILAVNIWLIASALLFLINNESLLNLVDDYKGPFFFIITGGISMLLQPGGFIDLKRISHEKNQQLSLLLLAGCGVAFAWSLFFNSNGFLLSIVVPFVALRVYYAMSIKKA
jgi:hypothetical protein